MFKVRRIVTGGTSDENGIIYSNDYTRKLNNDIMGQLRKTKSAARDARTLVDVVSLFHKNNNKANLTTT